MPSSDAVLATLDWIVKQGFRAVPLRKQSKAALDEKYVDLNYVSPPRSLWEGRDLGIGVVTGPKYNGPLDADVDCKEAVYFAQKFLPTTDAIFGRASKRSSHYQYVPDSPECPKKAFVDPINKDTIIELRGDGGYQTVMPGSLHEATGEVVEWETENPEPTHITVEKLEFAIKKVAIAVLVLRHLWADGSRNQINMYLCGLLFYMGWPLDDTSSLIEAIMDLGGDTVDDRKTRIKTIKTTYKKGESGGKVAGATTLRAFCGNERLVDRIVEWAGDEQSAYLAEYNERFAVVAVQGKFRIAETIPLEKGDPPILFQKADFINFLEPDKAVFIDDKGKAAKVPKARLWLAHPRRRTYKAMKFLPGEEDTSPILNMWTGWNIDEHQMRTASCRAWLDLLFYTICGHDDKLNAWMLNWFANILREPKVKYPTCPVLIGEEGAGKSLLFKYFGKILGPAYVVAKSEEQVTNKFNSIMSTCLLLHSEEALYAGNPKHASLLRELISGDEGILEKKGIDAVRSDFYLRLVMTSNKMWCAPVSHKDRRYTVIDLRSRMMPAELVEEVMQEMNEGGPSALFRYLTEEWTYDPTISRVNVKNDDLLNLKIMNSDPTAHWWYDTLRSGSVLPDYLSWATKPTGEEWPKIVSSGAMHLAMQMHCKDSQKRAPGNTLWAMELNKMIGVDLNRKQIYFVNPMADDAPREVKLLPQKHYTIINMPPLVECRKAFERFVGQNVQWPVEPEERERPLHLRY